MIDENKLICIRPQVKDPLKLPSAHHVSSNVELASAYYYCTYTAGVRWCTAVTAPYLARSASVHSSTEQREQSSWGVCAHRHAWLLIQETSLSRCAMCQWVLCNREAGPTAARWRCMSAGSPLLPLGSCTLSKVGFASGPLATSSDDGDSKCAASIPSSSPALHSTQRPHPGF